jgi:tetratricopeptide (TPR) repeat protein
MGDLYRALGQGDQAQQAYRNSHAILERLAQAEPDRADYQRDLSVSYSKLGQFGREQGDADQSREYFLKDLAIAERLARLEPDRADYQVDLAISYWMVGESGVENPAEYFTRALSILNALKDQGRLSPADEPKIAALEQMLRDAQ